MLLLNLLAVFFIWNYFWTLRASWLIWKDLPSRYSIVFKTKTHLIRLIDFSCVCSRSRGTITYINLNLWKFTGKLSISSDLMTNTLVSILQDLPAFHSVSVWTNYDVPSVHLVPNALGTSPSNIYLETPKCPIKSCRIPLKSSFCCPCLEQCLIDAKQFNFQYFNSVILA